MSQKKKKKVFFSCYDYYYWMVKKKLYFFSIKFPAYICTCLWSHKVETFLEPERNLFVLVNRQLSLKRCRILWSSIHDCMSLGLSCGDVSHEIHVVCWWLERRLGAFLIGTSSNWFYFVRRIHLSLLTSLCLTWSAKNSRNPKIIFYNWLVCKVRPPQKIRDWLDSSMIQRVGKKRHHRILTGNKLEVC